ncbi:hypothetical protein [Nonomuraea pusilla]|nr:hypothetical protein [Nonomuraea pusilla]
MKRTMGAGPLPRTVGQVLPTSHMERSHLGVRGRSIGGLKGKGYRVDSLKPSDIGTQVAHQFEEQLKRTALSDDIPEKGMRDGEYFMPHLAPAMARQYATKEIKAALDDLECGRNFYAAYEPRNKEISERVTQLFGGGPL